VYKGGLIGAIFLGWDTIVTGNRNESGVSPAIGWDNRKNPPGPSNDNF
jgi:hypothetical protein